MKISSPTRLDKTNRTNWFDKLVNKCTYLEDQHVYFNLSLYAEMPSMAPRLICLTFSYFILPMLFLECVGCINYEYL